MVEDEPNEAKAEGESIEAKVTVHHPTLANKSPICPCIAS
jgi:hypothetical protein